MNAHFASFWSRIPLLGRLIAIAGVALVLAAGLMLVLTFSQDANEARRDLQHELHLELDQLPAAIADSLVVGDYATLQQVLDRKVVRSEIVRIRFVDGRGAQLASAVSVPSQHAPAWFAAWAGLHDLSGSADVVIGGRRYGQVELTLTAQIAADRVWRRATAELGILLFALAIDFVGIVLVLRSGLGSVRALSDASLAISQGDLSVRLNPVGSPEMRNSIDAFNRMAEAIGEARSGLTLEKERLEVTLASIGDAVITTGSDGQVTYLNPVAERLTGWKNSEASGKPLPAVLSLIGEGDRKPAQNPVDRALKAGKVVESAKPLLLVDRSGLEHPIAESAAPIRIAGGEEILGVVIVFRDQSEERELYQLMRLSGSVFQHAQEGIMITDADAVILNVNPAFTELTGYAPEDVIGKQPSVLSSGLNDPRFYANMWATIMETGHWRGEIWNRKKNNELYAELLTITAVPSETGGRGHYVGVFSDITELKLQQRHLERIAHYDALTHLPNRVLLADRMKVALAQTRRNGTTLAICYLDLDGFKPVNDSFGHETGDRLLIDLSQRLTMALRAGDTVARLGGDEFVLLLSGMRDIDEVRATLDRLQKVIARPYEVKDGTIAISASIGVSLFPQDDTDPDTLLRHADQAMYTAKENGRNRYHLFDHEHGQRARAHREAVGRIETALAKDEFVLYYQPQVDMRRGEVIGAEALIRWNHPERGLLPPSEFLPLIENSDFAIRLDEWVIETALDQLERWRSQGLRLSVSVNISARHLQQKDMPARLAAALARHPGIRPGDLELEILETSALDDMLHATTLITECQHLGVRFALDDFGTGYSSLSYFKRLPADTLKIDQSFVRDMLRDAEDLAIVEGVLGLAEAFNRKIIAEGVETVAHGTMLLRIGVEWAQGYGIARPMPADVLPGWVATWIPPSDWISAAQDVRLRRGLTSLS